MSDLIVAVSLLACILCAWLGVAGFVRLRTPLDRLHCVTFVNAGCGAALIVASLAADGLSNRTGNVVLVAALSLLGGAATSHALGRALRQRGSVPEAE